MSGSYYHWINFNPIQLECCFIWSMKKDGTNFFIYRHKVFMLQFTDDVCVFRVCVFFVAGGGVYRYTNPIPDTFFIS